MNTFAYTKKIFTIILAILLCFVTIFPLQVLAQSELDSTTYKIVDPTVDSGGGVAESTNYGILESLGNPTADARLQSGTYEIGSGFPNGIQANVPLIRCAETNTTSGTTSCIHFPNLNGAQGECGTPGCYDRMKLEIDSQNNPTDALYLVRLIDNTTSTTFYLTTSHTLSATPPTVSNNFMTICEIEGIDTRSNSGCEISSDPEWDEDLQRTNIYGLNPNTTYTISVAALHGDYTQSRWSPSTNGVTVMPQLVMDIDIGTASTAETNPPHAVSFGDLIPGSINTPSNRIWMDLGTNVVPGLTTYVKDVNNGLSNGADVIPSQSENLSVDSGADGGFGLQIGSATQSALGPILEGATYDLASENVGQVSTTNATIFSTNTTGTNRGQVTNGRASIIVKALSVTTTPGGVYGDTLTFSMIANF